jgi:hypothetical protein
LQSKRFLLHGEKGLNVTDVRERVGMAKQHHLLEADNDQVHPLKRSASTGHSPNRSRKNAEIVGSLSLISAGWVGLPAKTLSCQALILLTKPFARVFYAMIIPNARYPQCPIFAFTPCS